VNEGQSGGRSNRAVDRIGSAVTRHRPAYTLVLYGTNDWNQRECKVEFPCFTIDSLRRIVQRVRGGSSLPVLSTIPPPNVGFDVRSPPSRGEWVSSMNELIRSLATEEGAVLADPHAAFLREASLSGLFVDHVHPNDRGYEILAAELFRALTRPSGASAAAEYVGAAEVGSPALLVPPDRSPGGPERPGRVYHRMR
jgi:lysophospholipase L1-like esterase